MYSVLFCASRLAWRSNTKHRACGETADWTSDIEQNKQRTSKGARQYAAHQFKPHMKDSRRCTRRNKPLEASGLRQPHSIGALDGLVEQPIRIAVQRSMSHLYVGIPRVYSKFREQERK